MHIDLKPLKDRGHLRRKRRSEAAGEGLERRLACLAHTDKHRDIVVKGDTDHVAKPPAGCLFRADFVEDEQIGVIQ
jgi:hypothetical protein